METKTNSSISTKTGSQQQRRIIPQVPPQFKKANVNVYKPRVVSLGPYHHGESEFLRAELFKQKSLDAFTNFARSNRGAGFDKSFFLDQIIMQEIDEIRKCYDSEAMDRYSNEELGEMMLRDACFIICHMYTVLGGNMEMASLMWERFTMLDMPFISQDVLILENQIPLRVVKLLFAASLSNSGEIDESVWKTVVCKYLGYIVFENPLFFTQAPWNNDDDEPFHLLEIFQQTQLPGGLAKQGGGAAAEAEAALHEKMGEHITATNLKAKGIQIKPSHSVGMVSFTSYPNDELRIPPWWVTPRTLLFLSNMIAYEMTAGDMASNKFSVTASVNFLKSLIQTADDVMVLREKGVLLHNVGGDEEVVKIFKDVSTLGWDN